MRKPIFIRITISLVIFTACLIPAFILKAQNDSNGIDDNTAFYEGVDKNYIIPPPRDYKLEMAASRNDGYSFAFVPEDTTYQHAEVIIGSNIFNVLMVIGITSVIKPIEFTSSVLAIDGIIMIGITLLFLTFATSLKKISRIPGIILLTSYIAYFSYLVWRL